MNPPMVEGNLLFEFGDDWTHLIRWDRHAAYLNGMKKSHEGKAVDFIGVYKAKTPYFIEVKDYRHRSRAPEKGPLERELELKVRCTAAALLGARCREQHEECVLVFEAVVAARKPLLVLWLEETPPERTPGPTVSRHRETRAAVLRDRIRQNVAWFEAETIVTSIADSYQTVVPDVRVKSLEPARTTMVEDILTTLEKRQVRVPERLEWRIRDCLDSTELAALAERARHVSDPWKLFKSRT